MVNKNDQSKMIFRQQNFKLAASETKKLNPVCVVGAERGGRLMDSPKKNNNNDGEVSLCTEIMTLT